MASVSWEQIYKALTGAGASTIQAIGIMANMINESSGNPEAIGDDGTSFGLVQQHGDYAYLVTGNPIADMDAQIKLLVQNGGLSAASGSTGSEAAGNFAANYERCVGCQAGGQQYNSRVSNAAQVIEWIASGKWPASAGSTSSASTASSVSSSGGIIGDIENILGLGAAANFASDISSFFDKIMWILEPGSWLRIGSFFIAALLLLVAIIIFSKADQKITAAPIPIPVPI